MAQTVQTTQTIQAETGSQSSVDEQAYIEILEKENKYLKSLLDEAGIQYESDYVIGLCNQVEHGHHNSHDHYETDQGARIIHQEITEQLAREFFSMFWGRMDVYAKRTVNHSTGMVGYYPQCSNFWKSCCPRKHKSKIRCQDCDLHGKGGQSGQKVRL